MRAAPEAAAQQPAAPSVSGALELESLLPAAAAPASALPHAAACVAPEWHAPWPRARPAAATPRRRRADCRATSSPAGVERCGLVTAVVALLLGVAVTAASLRGAAAAASPPAHVVALDWTVTVADVSPGAPLPAVPTLLVNGAWPPPTVEAAAGDAIELTLRNALPDAPLAVHWHGIAQRGTPQADGAAHASAPPVPPGGSATVRFAAWPPGTHLWHGHVGLANAEGLAGALIVTEPPNVPPLPAPYDAEATLLLSDWWAAPLPALREGLLRRGDAFRWVGDPDALLVNGRPAGLLAGPAGGIAAEVAMPRGRTLRLRLASATSLSHLTVCARGHTLRVAQAGGDAPIAPFDVDEVLLNAGERLSVLLTPSDAARAAGVVWLTLSVRHRPHGPLGVVALRLPRDEGDADAAAVGDDAIAAAAVPPAAPPPTQSAWNDTAATVRFYSRLAAPPGAPPPPAQQRPPLLLRGAQARVGGLMRWTVADVAFAYPGDPLLRDASAPGPEGDAAAASRTAPAMLDVAEAAARGNAEATAAAASWEQLRGASTGEPGGIGAPAAAHMGTAVVRLPRHAVQDIVLLNAPALNGVSEQHPWHMHGGAFWLLGTGQGAWRPDTAPAASPPRLDTLTLPPGGWAWLRLAADNAGAWPLHCHVTWHVFMGMQLVLLVE